MQCPQQNRKRDRQDEQQPEIVCGIVGSSKCLNQVADGDTAIEYDGVDRDRALKGEATSEGEYGCQTKCKVGYTDFKLERALLSADLRGCDRREKHVENSRPQPVDSHSQQQDER